MYNLRSVVLCLWKLKKVYKFATLKTFLFVTSNVWLFSTTTNFTVTGVQ